MCVHMGVSSCGHICMTETFTLVNISGKLFDIDYIWHNQRCTIASFDGFREFAKQMRTQMSIWRQVCTFTKGVVAVVCQKPKNINGPVKKR